MPNRIVTPLLLCLLAPGGLPAEEGDAGRESRLLTGIRQVTFEGRRAGEGYFSRDGSRFVFQSEREPGNPFFQIYMMDLETGDTRRLSPGTGKTTCAWFHPGRESVIFASSHADPGAEQKQRQELEARSQGRERRYSWDYDEHYDLYQISLESGDLERLTGARGYDAEASLSPDGQWIVFASNRHAYRKELSAREQAIFENDKSYFLDLYLMRSDGSGLRRLTATPGYDGGPFFSPDGREIVWRRFAEDGSRAEIFAMSPGGGRTRQITRLEAMSWAPFYHPTGDYLAFATNLHGFANFEVYLVDSRGESEPVRVTFTEGFDGLPVFSPDGTRLAWTSNRSENRSQIFFADWNDVEARRLLGLSAPAVTTTGAISEADLKSHLEMLAGEETEGRMTGSPGMRKAAGYVVSALRGLGLRPAGEDRSWFQEFEFTAGVSLGPDNRLTLRKDGGPQEYEVDGDWRPLSFSRTGTIQESGVVFAGYGLVAPEENGQQGYDSYVHLDVEGKWVMVLRYLPDDVAPERRQHLAPYSALRYKAMQARDRGAAGILVVSGPASRVREQLVKLSFDASTGGTSLGAISVTDALAQRILDAAGRDLAALQKELDGGEPVIGFEIAGVELAARVDVVQEKRTGRNILARLPSGSREAPVVVGAHLDHLGRGEGTSSLAREDEKNEIHYGADDNASGVGGLLELAEYLAGQVRRGRLRPKRDIVFAFWSGEELGLIGSNHYVSALSERIGTSSLQDRIAAYLNLDMIGRLDEKVIIQGVGSSSVWPARIERANVPVGLALTTQDDSYLPTDATSFYLKGVPVLSAFTGPHEDYHSPRDTADKLDYAGMRKIAHLMALITRSLATSDDAPDYREMEKPESQPRARLRAYLGTIPDYAQAGVAGVKLSGVIRGGPAQQAGLEAGDVIVELAGRRIENIYDYTYAIEALKIGETVEVVVVRSGRRLTLEVTPASRE